MKRIFPASAAAAILVLAPLPAAQAGADAFDGFYVELRAGASFLEDADNDGPNISGETDFDVGTSFGGAVGYSFARHDFGYPFLRNFRIEAEVIRQENDVDDVTGTINISGSPGQSDNEFLAHAFMANVYYDFETRTRFTPYIGVGVGGAIVDLEAGSGANRIVDDDEAVFAYQARAGVAYELSPNAAITLGYRFLDTIDPEFRAVDGTELESEFRSHAAELGLRFTF